MVDQTNPEIMAGNGSYEIIATRGLGEPPKKRRDLVPEPDETANSTEELVWEYEIGSIE